MNWKNAILALALILALGLLIWLLIEKSHSSDLARDMQRLRSSSNQTSDQLNETQRARDLLSRQATDKDREIRQLRMENERSAAAAQLAATSMQWELDSLRSAESRAQAETDQHRQAAEAAATELAATQSHLAELEKRLESLAGNPSDSEYQSLLGSQAEAQTKLESLIVDLDQTQSENEHLRREAEAAARELTAAKNRIQELESRLKELEAAARPEAEFQALVSSEAGARAQVLALDKDKAENLSRIADLTARLEQARAEIEGLKKELSERPAAGPPAEPAENKDEGDPGLLSELQELRRELESGRTARSELEDELKAARSEAAVALAKSKAEVTRLDGELSRAVKAGSETRASLTECEKASAGHQARTGALEAEAARLKMEKNALRDNVATVFVDQLLFNSGSVTLSGAGMEAAARVVNQSPDRAVLVVGHSDAQAPNRQLSRYYPSNWELSAARAAAVVRHLTEKGGVDPVRLSLVGQSHYQPAVHNETDEDRQQNRRVEIILSNQLRSAAEAP